MKIIIETNSKEIADLVSQLQNQPQKLCIDSESIKSINKGLLEEFKSSAPVII